MGDFGKGIKSFKKGLNEDDKTAPPPAQIPAAGADATVEGEAKVESQSKPQ
jgi:sec-independent protein translocase protein TatA